MEKKTKEKKINGFFAKCRYYLKDSVFAYSYILVGGFLGTSFMFMQKNGMIPNYITAILSALNMILCAVVLRNIFFKTGEEAMTLKHGNDVERRHMIETDNYFELDKVKEYDVKKAVIFSVIAVFPQAMLLLIKLIGTIAAGSFTALDGVIRFFCGVAYPVFYTFDANASAFYGAVSLIVFVAPILVGYISGGKKVSKVYEKAEQIKRELGGGEQK